MPALRASLPSCPQPLDAPSNGRTCWTTDGDPSPGPPLLDRRRQPGPELVRLGLDRHHRHHTHWEEAVAAGTSEPERPVRVSGEKLGGLALPSNQIRGPINVLSNAQRGGTSGPVRPVYRIYSLLPNRSVVASAPVLSFAARAGTVNQAVPVRVSRRDDQTPACVAVPPRAARGHHTPSGARPTTVHHATDHLDPQQAR